MRELLTHALLRPHSHMPVSSTATCAMLASSRTTSHTVCICTLLDLPHPLSVKKLSASQGVPPCVTPPCLPCAGRSAVRRVPEGAGLQREAGQAWPVPRAAVPQARRRPGAQPHHLHSQRPQHVGDACDGHTVCTASQYLPTIWDC